MNNAIQTYLSKVNEQYKTGNATEHSYRGAMADLFTAIINDSAVTVVNEPKRSDCGAPDYIISRGEIPLGFVEAKDIGKNLDDKGYKEQFDRYKNSLDNLIITDYLEFRFYRNGELYDKCRIGSVIDGNVVGANNIRPDLAKGEGEYYSPLHFENLLRDFITNVTSTIKSPIKLAEMMAGKAKMLAEVIRRAIETDVENGKNTTLTDQMKAFQQILIHDITPASFADIYAQTITYGMFAARLHDTTMKTFSRQEAATLIPKTNPFLRNLFQYISGYDVDDRILWIVDSLAEIFVHTDIAELLKNFGRATRTHDPIIHFYETFLAEYDPKLRKARGVWYTPEPVVNFIVRAVDDILKSEFNLPEGLADTSKTTIKVEVQNSDKRAKGDTKLVDQEIHRVQILDPATGTGTFLAEVIKQIHCKFEGMEGLWSAYVEKDLIPRLNGFEILMASYAMAHLKLDLLLKETGYEPNDPSRFRVFLTNSLEEAHPDTGTLFANWLSQEASEANAVKREAPVMVVIGNPPYSVSSNNKGDWILELIKDYKKDLNERKINLDDDYIKFIRYGEHFIEKNGEGVLAYISNNSFIDGITHRQMRKHLLETFDKIYILDLHGNSKKKEVCEDGSRDENVFDIMAGVSINLFVKSGKKKTGVNAKVFHHELYGKRQFKYEQLIASAVCDNNWQPLEIQEPYYFFVPKDFDLEKSYSSYLAIDALFGNYNSGIQTGKDEIVTDFNKENLYARMTEVLSADEQFVKSKYEMQDTSGWNLSDFRSAELSISKIQKTQYKPFDSKFIYYDEKTIKRTRASTVSHLLAGDNLSLICMRQYSYEVPDYCYSFISREMIPDRFFMSYKGTPYICPLYLYPDTPAETNSLGETITRTPNLNMTMVKEIEEKLGLTFTPEKSDIAGTFAPIDLLDYIYAVLHSPTYREKYKEFLKIDFPRVPYPTDADKFWQLVKLGGEIRGLHLMESELLSKKIATYPKAGDNIVTRKLTTIDSWRFTDEEKGIGQVWINDVQYFENVPLIAWEFYIGGYQPAQKWLKDRKERVLTIDDIRHYMKIIVALVETDRVMKEIDKIGVEG